MKRTFIFFTLLLALAATACGAPSTPPIEDPPLPTAPVTAPAAATTAPTDPGGYPPPVADNGYPGAASLGETLPDVMLPVPAPAGGNVGTVTGVMTTSQSGSERRPAAGLIIYLGNVVYLADGTPAMASLDRSSPLKAQTSQVGQFIIENVPAGQYTLLLDQITQTFLLNNPASGGDLLITVAGGDIVDLGELAYTDLPLREN